MTTILNEITRDIATSSPYDATAGTLSAIAVLALLGLLVAREFLRARGYPRQERWVQTLNIAILPLTLAFGYLVAVRFLALLPL